MNIAERLENMRTAFPACETAAYADLSSKMILSWSAAGSVKQEVLNTLCDNAVEMLDGASTPQLSNLLGSTEHARVHQVIVLDPDNIGIFLRSTSSPFDALCCICTPTVDIPAFLRGAHQHLNEIGAEA